MSDLLNPALQRVDQPVIWLNQTKSIAASPGIVEMHTLDAPNRPTTDRSVSRETQSQRRDSRTLHRRKTQVPGC